jgi:hypothetical protein
MIVSHRHRFIFIKTRKTAGTSIELALSEHCGPDDVITRLMPHEDAMRTVGPQKVEIPLRRYTPRDWAKTALRRRRRKFSFHTPASEVARYVDPDVWGSYYRFTVERNPYDKAISLYWWWTSSDEQRPTFDEFLRDIPASRLSNWGMYTIGDEVAVDQVCRYETLDADLAEVSNRIGVPIDLSTFRAKSHTREDRRPYREVITPDQRARIELLCARELDAFSYTW